MKVTMIDTEEEEVQEQELDKGLTDQLREVLRDAIDYAQSVLALLQARTAEMALSGVVFVAALIAAAILAMGAIVLLLVALGFWLAHVTGSAAVAVLILGGVAALLAGALAWYALRWLSTLRS
jgi:hypothetical protein